MAGVRGFEADREYYYWQLEKLASELRRELAPGMAFTEALPGPELYDALDKETVEADGREVILRTDTQVLPRGTLGETYYDRRNDRLMLVLSEDTYLGLESDDGRARFSFFHEIGHVALHPELLLRIAHIHREEAALQRAMAAPYPRYRDTEFQANYMAAALLIPAIGLEELSNGGTEFLLASDVMRRFKVSRTTAEHRLENFYESRMNLLRGVRHLIGK